MNDRTDSWIDTALDDLAAADARVVAPATLEAAVLGAWDAQQTADDSKAARLVRSRRAAAWLLVPAAAAALIVIAMLQRDPAAAPDGGSTAARVDPRETFTVAPPTPAQRLAVVPPVARGVSSSAAATSVEMEYVIVPEPFSDAASLHVVRVRMARMALATLGMPITDPDADGLVDVEMLVGDDGVARSIRNATFVRDSTDRGAER